jgi:hypothetical protein
MTVQEHLDIISMHLNLLMHETQKLRDEGHTKNISPAQIALNDAESSFNEFREALTENIYNQ